MEPECSLPPSHKRAKSPYSESDNSSPYPLAFSLRIHFNIIFTFSPGSSKWFLYLGFSYQIPVRTNLLPISATWLAHIVFLDLMTPKNLNIVKRALRRNNLIFVTSSGKRKWVCFITSDQILHHSLLYTLLNVSVFCITYILLIITLVWLSVSHCAVMFNLSHVYPVAISTTEIFSITANKENS